MKVKELIEQLSAIDKDAEVSVYGLEKYSPLAAIIAKIHDFNDVLLTGVWESANFGLCYKCLKQIDNTKPVVCLDNHFYCSIKCAEEKKRESQNEVSELR